MIRIAVFLAFATVTARATITVAATAAAARIAIAITAGTTVTTTVAAIATRFARFASRTGVFQFFAGFLIDDAHRQANLATVVDFENLDLNFLPFGHDVGRLFDALVLHF